MVLIDSGAMHNFVSAAFAQAVQVITINIEPMCVILGDKFKVLSIKLAKLSISFASGALQTVWYHILPELSAPVILGKDWLTQFDHKISWVEKNNKPQIIQMCFWKLII